MGILSMGSKICIDLRRVSVFQLAELWNWYDTYIACTMVKTLVCFINMVNMYWLICQLGDFEMSRKGIAMSWTYELFEDYNLFVVS